MEIIADDLERPNEQIENTGEQNNADVTPNEKHSDADDNDNDDDDDGEGDADPPNCERHQFATYIMSSIGVLPEKSAAHAMAAIKLYFQKWPGYADDWMHFEKNDYQIIHCQKFHRK